MRDGSPYIHRIRYFLTSRVRMSEIADIFSNENLNIPTNIPKLSRIAEWIINAEVIIDRRHDE